MQSEPCQCYINLLLLMHISILMLKLVEMDLMLTTYYTCIQIIVCQFSNALQ